MTAQSHFFPFWISHNILVPAACCYIAGAALAASFSILIQPVLFSTAIVAVGLLFLLYIPAAVGYQKHNIHNSEFLLFLTLIFLTLVGFIHTCTALQPPKSPAHIYNLVPQRTLVTLEGTVISMISYRGNKSRFTLSIHHIIRRNSPGAGKPIPATGKIQLSVSGHIDSSVLPGKKVLVIALVDKISNFQTPGTFNYALYMHNRGVYNSGWIRSLQQIHVIAGQRQSFSTKIILFPEKIRQKISRFLEDRFNPEISGLYQALLIGERSNLSPKIREQFIRTGTMHLLSISGLHLGLLALMLYVSLSWIMKHSQWLLLHTHMPTLAMSFSFPILLFYALVAGMNIPVFRSLIMAGVLLFALLLRRQTSILNLVAAAALIVLTVSPLSLFTASFQLSFSAMVALALIYPRLNNLIASSPDSNPENRRTIALLRWPLTAFLISLAATVGTLPFLLYHFNRFSPIGPIMNLLVEPLLCFIALPLGLLAAPLITVAPSWAEFLFKIGAAGLTTADKLTSWAGSFHYASLWTITPSSLEILLYFILIIWACSRTHRWKKTILISISALFILNFFFGIPKVVQQSRPFTKISFLDVGQGTATLFEFIDGTRMLLDGGGSYSERYNVGSNVIAPFLWKQRIRKINTLIITHPDSDHFSGLPFIITHFHPDVVYTNGQNVRTGNYYALMKLISNKEILKKQAIAGMILHNDSLCTLTCLGMQNMPVAVHNPSDNNQSIVLSLQCGENTFLFPGDIEENAEDFLLLNKVPLKADVFLAAHHGSATSNSHTFLRAVAPQLIIVSAGRTKNDIFPSRNHKRWWLKTNIPFVITGINGTIICTTDGRNITTTMVSGSEK